MKCSNWKCERKANDCGRGSSRAILLFRLVDTMKKTLANLAWILVATAGAWAYATLAFHRGEALNSVFILIAALCSYAIGYRFYSKWLAARVLMLNDRRATPCEVHDDGKDFVKTNLSLIHISEPTRRT